MNSSFACPSHYRPTVEGTFRRYASIQDQNTSSNFQEKLQAIKTHTYTHMKLLGVLKPTHFWFFYSEAQWKQLFMFLHML